MAKTITLRYPARCADCGADLEVGTVARWYGRGRVYGTACHASNAGAGTTGDGLKWWGGKRARATRCEDAPCCGCCGPQGDGGEYYEAYGDR